jgi:hypothetical protein
MGGFISRFRDCVEQQYSWLAQHGCFGSPVPEVPAGALVLERIISEDKAAAGCAGRHMLGARLSQVRLVRDAPGLRAGTRLLLKEYTDIEAQASECPVKLDLLKRSLTLGADSAYADNPLLVLPRAISFGEHPGALYDLWDTDLERYLAEVKLAHGPDQRLVGRKILDALRRSAEAVDSFHRAGGAHRDIKGSNFLCMLKDGELVRVGLSDFDLVGYVPGAAYKGGDVTRWLVENRVVIGTIDYLPVTFLRGKQGYDELPPTFLDEYAFGCMIRSLAFDLAARHDPGDGSITSWQRMEDLRRGDEWRPVARARGIEDLALLWWDLTDEGRISRPGAGRACTESRAQSYIGSRMEKVARGIALMQEGRGAELRKDKELRRAMLYRKGEDEGRKAERWQHARRAFAAAALVGLSLAAGTQQYLRQQERTHAEEERRSYAQSLDGLAKRAAAEHLSPRSLGEFIAAVERKSDVDLATVEPRLRTGTRKVFPFLLTPQLEQFYTGADTPSGYLLDYLLARYRLKGLKRDARIIDRFITYAERLTFEWSTQHNDRLQPAIWRFAPLLEAPRVFADASQERKERLARLQQKGLCAAVMALRHYNAQSKTFPGIRDLANVKVAGSGPASIDLLQEQFLIPFIAAIAEYPDLDSILAPARLKPMDSDPSTREIVNYARSLPPLQLHDLYSMIADSGRTACRLLVNGDGKSFWRARITGTVVERKAMSDLEPGYWGDERAQSVLAQHHVLLMISMSYRLRVLENLSDPGGAAHKRIARELGRGAEQYFANIRSAADDLRRCRNALQFYMDARTKGDALPEYLYLPSIPATSSSVVPRNMLPECGATMMYAGNAMLTGDTCKVRKIVEDILQSTKMNSSRDVWGILLATRGVRAEWVCPNILTERDFIRVLGYVNESGYVNWSGYMKESCNGAYEKKKE